MMEQELDVSNDPTVEALGGKEALRFAEEHWRRLHHPKLFPGLPEGCTGYVEMVGTPIHAVPQDEKSRQLAGIHPDARFFCFFPKRPFPPTEVTV